MLHGRRLIITRERVWCVRTIARLEGGLNPPAADTRRDRDTARDQRDAITKLLDGHLRYAPGAYYFVRM